MSEIDEALPLSGRILVRPYRPSESDGAKGEKIHLPEDAQSKMEPDCGEVLRAGPDSGDVGAGDKVWYQRMAGYEVELDREVFVVLREQELLLRLPGAAVTGRADDAEAA